MYKVIISASILVTLVTCQAPGDESQSCLSAGPSNTRVLMDSNNYATLLGPGGVWTAADFDGSGTTWSPGSGGNCQRTLFVCDKSLAPNNWAFTQYVSKAGNIVANITIFINITVRFSSCNPSCPKILSVYNFIVNSQQTPLNQSITNFTLLSTITGSSTATFGTVLSFNLKPNDAGFYVAFRDGGSCTSLNRVQIYYYQCPALQMGLALYPLTPAPTKQNSPAAVNASCVSGGINSTSLSLQCDNSGAWNGSVNCLCSSSYGYMTVGGSCTGCGAGQWLDISNNSCMPCPGNCSLNLVVTSICPCLGGYFRASTEGPDVGCTAPPTVPNNLRMTSVTNTSITLQWEKPDDVGRNDYYFVLEYRPIGSLQFITVSNVTDTSDTIIYILSGLTPYITYDIHVIARNGVSDQDWYDECTRTATISSATLQGVPGVISDIAVIGGYVTWQRPVAPNGIIVNYNLRVLAANQTSNTIWLNASSFFYQVQSSDIPPLSDGNAYVQVSAQTTAGEGGWSVPQLLRVFPSPAPSVCTTSVSCSLPSLQALQCSTCSQMSSPSSYCPCVQSASTPSQHSVCSSEIRYSSPLPCPPCSYLSSAALDMTSPPCSPCPLQLSCSQCSTLCPHVSSSSVGLSSSQSPLPSLCLISGSFGLCSTLLTSQAAQSMDDSGIQQNVIGTYLGVAIGVLFAIAAAIIAGVLIIVYLVRRDYKRKKLEFANTAASRETDSTVTQDIPIETFESKDEK